MSTMMDLVAFDANGNAYMIGYDAPDVAKEMGREIASGRAARVERMTTSDACAAHMEWLKKSWVPWPAPLSPPQGGGHVR